MLNLKFTQQFNLRVEKLLEEKRLQNVSHFVKKYLKNFQNSIFVLLLDEFPWQISLRNLGSHICGGSIINENQVITAAHCVEGASPALDTVSINDFFFSSKIGPTRICSTVGGTWNGTPTVVFCGPIFCRQCFQIPLDLILSYRFIIMFINKKAYFLLRI